MRFAIFSKEADCLSWWARLYEEGSDVLVYTPDVTVRDVGLNIVPLTANRMEWEMWARLRPADTVVLFDCGGPAEYAEELRRAGLAVVGTGDFCARLEDDREFGIKLAQAVGIKVPEYHQFPTITAAIKHAADSDECWVFKSNRRLEASATYMADSPAEMVFYLEWIRDRFGDKVACILQEKLDGVALSTERWWNGKAWIGPYIGSIEHKKFMNDDVGPSTGCAINAVWYYEEPEPEIARRLHWEKLAEHFLKHDAPPGIYDINALIAEDGEAYFLEWTPRLGYDTEPLSQRGLDLPLSDFLEGIAFGTMGDYPFDPSILWGVRVSVAPYPWEHVKTLQDGKATCIGTPVWNPRSVWADDFLGYGLAAKDDGQEGYYVADPEGAVGIAFAMGDELSALNKAAIKTARGLGCPGIMFRTDGAKTVAEDAKKLAEMGYNDLHEGLVR